jgi:hypothetical protein
MFTLPTVDTILYYYPLLYALLIQRLSASFQCMHGSKCKVGSYCTVGRRLQEFNILGGLILPVWGTIEKALAKQVWLWHLQVVVLLVIFRSWMVLFMITWLVVLGILLSLLSCLVLWFSSWHRIFVLTQWMHILRKEHYGVERTKLSRFFCLIRRQTV